MSNTEDPTKIQIGGSHYKGMAIQPAEFITKNNIPFLEGCVIKRMCRHESKDGWKDLLKAKHEIDLILKLKYSCATTTAAQDPPLLTGVAPTGEP